MKRVTALTDPNSLQSLTNQNATNTYRKLQSSNTGLVVPITWDTNPWR